MSARPDTWMPMYWGDYVRDTGHLNAAGHGAYLMLIKHYWCAGEPLRDDDDELWRIACCDSKKEWLTIRWKVVRLFQVDGKLIRHKRIDKELAKAVAGVAAKAEAGKKGAEKRWQKGGRSIAELSDSDGAAIADPTFRQAFANATSPSPSESSLAASSAPKPRANGHGDTPEPSKDNNFTGIEAKSGRYVVGGFYFDKVRDRVYEAAGIDNAKWLGTDKPLVVWMSDNIEPDIIVAAVRRCAERVGYQAPSTLKYFDKAVREQRA